MFNLGVATDLGKINSILNDPKKSNQLEKEISGFKPLKNLTFYLVQLVVEWFEY